MYKSSLDKLSRIIPAAMCLFALLMAGIGYAQEKTDFLIIYAIPSVFMLVLTAACYLYSPKGYSVDSSFLFVHRLAGTFKIPRAEILHIRQIDSKELGRVWRMAGNGGVFGYTGWFSSSKLGKMRWFVTRRDRAVLVELQSGRKYLLSPDEPQALLDALS